MLQMIDPDTALRLVLEHTPPPKACTAPLADSLGLRLAEPVVADRDYPPFSRATMDGFAVIAADAGKRLRIAGILAAGDVWHGSVSRGTAIEIMTGAPCPDGADAVVQKEIVSLEGEDALIPAEVKPGMNIVPAGAECQKGAEVLGRGARITPLAIANLATFGYTRVHVYRAPSLMIITTGNEVSTPGEEPGPAHIRNSNGPMLAAMARSLGIATTPHVHARDTMDALSEALHTARGADIVVLTGAVSAGKFDQVPAALKSIGAELVFHRIQQRPGKPILFAKRNGQLLFGLPGNPLSAHLGFHRYVAAAIRAWMGYEGAQRAEHGRLAESAVIKGARICFQLARVSRDADGWKVLPLKGVGSADMHSVAAANALVRFEPDSGLYTAGTLVSFEWTPPTLE